MPPALHTDGRPDFAKIAVTAAFGRGLERVIKGTELGFGLVLCCSEKHPMGCHRSRLLGPALADRGVSPLHLLHDGRTVPHARLPAVGQQRSLF